jgi:hypothetical protein
VPAEVNDVLLECSEESRGGEVIDLFRGKQIMIEKKLARPYEDSVTGEMVEYKPFIIEGVRVSEPKGEKVYNKVRLFVGDPVFRREDRGNRNARPIGYRIPRRPLTAADFKDKTPEEKRELYCTVWRKQGERNGQNIYLALPEAFALRDGKEIKRDGVTVKMAGFDKGILTTTAQTEGASASRGQDRFQGRSYRR